ncbi:MAG TPA: histidine phosphatase family protein [Thermoleophilaceae bacterium]|nr:histidine phosphatase family protein [Thermoleophilaceae bacterium]
MKVYLARHGETEWSLSKQHTGRTDIPLTDNGHRQAEALRRLFADRPVEKAYTSPLSRSVETARLAGFEHAERRDELLEFDYGEYEGATTAQIRAERPDWYLWRDGCPGGETPAEVAERVGRLIDELCEGGVDAALFGHGHVLRALAARWLGLAPEGGGLFALETATLSSLGYEREVPVMWGWNQRWEGSGLPQNGD